MACPFGQGAVYPAGLDGQAMATRLAQVICIASGIDSHIGIDSGVHAQTCAAAWV
jgi:hypothetical protein